MKRFFVLMLLLGSLSSFGAVIEGCTDAQEVVLRRNLELVEEIIELKEESRDKNALLFVLNRVLFRCDEMHPDWLAHYHHDGLFHIITVSKSHSQITAMISRVTGPYDRFSFRLTGTLIHELYHAFDHSYSPSVRRMRREAKECFTETRTLQTLIDAKESKEFGALRERFGIYKARDLLIVSGYLLNDSCPEGVVLWEELYND